MTVPDGHGPSTAATDRIIGVVGLGNMGLPMAERLLAAGYDVRGLDRDESANQAAEAAGISLTGDVTQLARSCDVLVFLLPGSHVVDLVAEEVASVPIAERTCDLIVDMSSSSPERTKALGVRLADAGIALLDAPVSGGVAGARDGSLTIMVGGAAADLERTSPMFDKLGSRIIHVGGSGAGHAAKALNNLLSATHLLATNEALIVGLRFGIDPEVLNLAINGSSGRSGSTENKMPRFVLTRSFDSGFTSDLLVKDIGIATELAQGMGVDAPIGRAVGEWWRALAAELAEGVDHTEIIRPLEERNGVVVRSGAVSANRGHGA